MDRAPKRRSTGRSVARQRIARSGYCTEADAHRRLPTRGGKGFNILGSCRYGQMLYNRHDIYIGRSLAAYGEFAELEIELLRKILRPGQTAVDAGANIG